MIAGQAFGRARTMFALIAAAMAFTGVARTSALGEIGPYESRGKGGKSAHRKNGALGVQRAARKANNVRRNRKAHR